MDARHPAAEVEVDAEVARALLKQQHPEYAVESLELIDEGWDNVTYRVGSGHAMRIPRREVAVSLLENEQRWLPQLATGLEVEVPIPVAVGAPSELFPWPWTIVRWVAGETADRSPLDGQEAERLARVLRSLHRPAPFEAPFNAFRGVPLAARREVVEKRLDRLATPELSRMWDRALAAPTATTAVWLHGDLHPRNVVVREGRLVGLIDWGDLTGGDVATDLACAWTLFEQEGRERFRSAYGATEAEWTRAMGWAVNFGSGLLDSGEPRHVPIGEAIVRRLLDDGVE